MLMVNLLGLRSVRIPGKHTPGRVYGGCLQRLTQVRKPALNVGSPKGAGESARRRKPLRQALSLCFLSTLN